MKHSHVSVGFVLPPTVAPDFPALASKLTDAVSTIGRRMSPRFTLSAVLPWEATESNTHMARLASGLNWRVVAVGDPSLLGALRVDQAIGIRGFPEAPVEVVAGMSDILVCWGEQASAARAAFLNLKSTVSEQNVGGVPILTGANKR